MFLESPRFPDDINYGLTGGPCYHTQLIEQVSGWEQANSVWAYPKHQYQLTYAVKDSSTVEKLLHFFHAVKGRAHGFRFKDPNDYQSCSITKEISSFDQNLLGVADGVNTHFQLAKIYSVENNEGSKESESSNKSEQGLAALLATTRPIHKPVPHTVRVAISGIADKRWQCDYTTGKVTFTPDETAAISALVYDAAKQQLTLDVAPNQVVAGDAIYLDGMPALSVINQQRFTVIAATSESIAIAVPNIVNTAAEILIAEQLDTLAAYTGHGCFHTVPQPGEVVTAGFEFDVPVRFASDSLSISSDSYQVSSVQQLSLIEIRV